MYKFIRFFEFAKEIFDNEKVAKKASQIMLGILQAQSPRISDIADKMLGKEAANYKKVQRFLEQEDTQGVLKRLFAELSSLSFIFFRKWSLAKMSDLLSQLKFQRSKPPYLYRMVVD